jgi:hypothetical protein
VAKKLVDNCIIARAVGRITASAHRDQDDKNVLANRPVVATIRFYFLFYQDRIRTAI